VSQSSPTKAKAEEKKPVQHLNELKDLVVRYAKQETVDPLVGLKNTLIFGLSGAVCIGLGVSLALLGLLRGLQQLDFFADDGVGNGALSLVPYGATILVALIVIGLAVMGMSRSKAAKRRTGAKS